MDSVYERVCGQAVRNTSQLETNVFSSITPCITLLFAEWVPCGFLLAFSPFYLIMLHQRQTTVIKLPFFRPAAAKLFCKLMLILTTCVLMLKRNGQSREKGNMTNEEILIYVVKVTCFIALVMFGQYERKKGITSSFIQFFYWSGYTLGQSCVLYTAFELKLYLTDLLNFGLLLLNFALCFILVILNFWSEYPGELATRKGYMQIEEQPPCQLESASVPSSLFFAWIYGLLKAGFQNNVEISTMWSVPQSVSCDEVSTSFDDVWNMEIEDDNQNQISDESLKMRYYRKVKGNSADSWTNSSSSSYCVGESLHSEDKNGTWNRVIYTERTHLNRKQETMKDGFSNFGPYMYGGSNTDCNFLPSLLKNKKSQQTQPSLLRALWKMYRLEIVHFALYALLSNALLVLNPLLLRYVLLYLQQRHPDRLNDSEGYSVCLLMLFTTLTYSILKGRSGVLALHTRVSIRAATTTAVYKKLLRLRTDTKSEMELEDHLNVLKLDCKNIETFIHKLSECLIAPMVVVCVIAVIIYVFETAAIVCIFVVIVTLLLNLWIFIKKDFYSKKMEEEREIRRVVMSEMFNGMKVVKVHAWENAFGVKVHVIRDMEIVSLLRLVCCCIGSGLVWNIAEGLIMVCSFSIYTLDDVGDNILKPDVVFMLLMYLHMVKSPCLKLTQFVTFFKRGYLSLTRIQTFLLQQELTEDWIVVSPGSEHSVMLDAATFKWNLSSPFSLKNITLSVPQGSLVVVVGCEGSGKTSLLAAILGEMDKIKGTASRRDTLAYVPQCPWVQKSSLLDNVLFGKTYRETKVMAVLSACQLDEELESFGIDEDSIIHISGVDLTKSQHQRLSIARAVYHDCDVYLMDNPLSGLEVTMARAVFTDVLGSSGLLKNTTRIVTMTNLDLLQQADYIIVMNRGRIREMGSYNDLMQHAGPFVSYLKERLIWERMEGWQEENEEVYQIKEEMWDDLEKLSSDYNTTTSGDEGTLTFNYTTEQDLIGDCKLTANKASNNRIVSCGDDLSNINEMDTTHGSLQLKNIISLYMKPIGVLTSVSVLTTLVLTVVSDALTCLWVIAWMQDSATSPLTTTALITTPTTTTMPEERKPLDEVLLENNRFYVTLLTLYKLAQFLFLASFYFAFHQGTIRASKHTHNALVTRLYRAPLLFYYETSMSRLLNSCIKGIGMVDTKLPEDLRNLLFHFMEAVCVMVVVMATTPFAIPVLVIVMTLWIIITKCYSNTSRRLSRFEEIKQVPVCDHFSDSLRGTTTIRAFNATERFIQEFHRHLDFANSFQFGANIVYRWAELNTDIICHLLVFVVSICHIGSISCDVGLAGLTIYWTLKLSSILKGLTFSSTNLHKNFECLGQILQYSTISQEAKWQTTEPRSLNAWPFYGCIEFKGVSIVNQQNSTLLKDVNLKIKHGEKIGVVSLKTTHKDTMASSLFRLIELSAGAIYIDGVDLSTIGLHDLRSKLVMLPQFPVLFSGPLRFNLDPLGEFTEDEIWAALSRVHLKPFVMQLDQRLEFDMDCGGNNVSEGHRHLLCLARAILHKTCILLVEDISPTLDAGTGLIIDNVLYMAFQKCTVLRLTEKIDTLMHCDRVLIIAQDGTIQEFDSPTRLLKDPTSVLHSLANKNH